jgi:predicted DNA-binding protein
MNIEHLPKEHFDKLYSYRLSPGNKERVQNLF